MEEIEEAPTLIWVRQPGDRRRTASWRSEVADGCFLTLFDDGRTKFVARQVDLRDGFVIETAEDTADNTGGAMIRTRTSRR